MLAKNWGKKKLFWFPNKTAGWLLAAAAAVAAAARMARRKIQTRIYKVQYGAHKQQHTPNWYKF
jgi:hypothetical protein